MKRVVLAGTVGLSLFTSTAWAGVLMTATRDSVFADEGDNDAHKIPLNDDSATALKFRTTKPGKMIVTYNADCGVRGNGTSFLRISIRIDHALPENWRILCTETPGGVPVSAVRIMEVYPVKEGPVHSIQIEGQGVNTTRWDINHSFLSIVQ